MSTSQKGHISFNKGKTNIYSKETLEKMRNAKKGKPLSEEHKKHIRESLSGANHPMYGKKHSDEAKKKMAEKAKGRKSPCKGIKMSEETRRKSSEAHKGKGTKKVICLTTKVHFNSIIEAAAHYKCNKSGITQCCVNKRKTCGKLNDGTRLKWAYYEKVNIEVSLMREHIKKALI